MSYLIYIFIFAFGLIIGSFLNCLIWRLHKNETMLGRSNCPKCRHQLAWHDNIPLLSFIMLGGKCRYCGKKISWQYPLVELITGILFVIAFIKNFQFPINTQIIFFSAKPLILILRDWFLISVMVIIFIYDLRWYLILDIVSLPAGAVVFLLNLFLGYGWYNLLISGIIGAGFFFLQFIISKGKWIGGGDLRLGLLIGLALGWPDSILAIFLAYFIGSIIGLTLILFKKKQWGSQVPLGVFLSTAAIIALFWGNNILAWYFNIFRY